MRTLIVALTLCFGFLVAGDARAQPAVYFHLGTGRYLEAEKAGEERIKSAADRNTRNLAPLCGVYYKLRRYQKLAVCIDQLEARIAAGDRMHSDTMIFESDASALPPALKAGMLLELGQSAQALESGKIALSRIKPGTGAWGVYSDAQYLVELLPVMGIAAELSGQRAESERYLKMLDDLQIPYVGGQQRRNLREVGLAQLNISLARYEKALVHLKGEHLTWGLGVANFLLGAGDSFGTVYELPKGLMLGKSLFELGKIAEARTALDNLLSHKRASEQGDIYWIALFERGRIAEREGKPTEAIEFYRRAIEVIERQRASLTTEATKIGFVGNKQQVYGRLVALLVAGERAAEAFEIVERSKARALVDMLAVKKDFTARGADPENTRRVLAELDRADTEARAMSVASAGAEVGQVRSVRAITSDIQLAAPELASLVTVSTATLAELRKLIGDDEALVEYYYDESSLYAFVLTREGVQAVTLNRSGLTEQVAQFRRHVEDHRSDAWRASARELFERLIAPLQDRIKVRNLAFVPHGALHYLPFAALLGPDNQPLVERHGIRVLPSASVLKFLRPATPRASASLLVLGNPDLGDPKLDLEFAEGEARAVAAMQAGSRLLLRLDASETNFKKAASLFSHLHLATHGKFRAESPLDSGLMLARDGENDGLLRVSELYSMNLDAELVTLSACETGLGKIDNGDDVVGLTRGFLYAGARSIVATLWSVDDNATAELMKSFYGAIQTTGKRDALREAQIKTRAAFPHPFFWAAFQLIGRPD
jgi:CHAT domain-containing protein